MGLGLVCFYEALAGETQHESLRGRVEGLGVCARSGYAWSSKYLMGWHVESESARAAEREGQQVEAGR